MKGDCQSMVSQQRYKVTVLASSLSQDLVITTELYNLLVGTTFIHTLLTTNFSSECRTRLLTQFTVLPAFRKGINEYISNNNSKKKTHLKRMVVKVNAKFSAL